MPDYKIVLLEIQFQAKLGHVSGHLSEYGRDMPDILGKGASLVTLDPVCATIVNVINMKNRVGEILTAIL